VLARRPGASTGRRTGRAARTAPASARPVPVAIAVGRRLPTGFRTVRGPVDRVFAFGGRRFPGRTLGAGLPGRTRFTLFPGLARLPSPPAARTSGPGLPLAGPPPPVGFLPGDGLDPGPDPGHAAGPQSEQTAAGLLEHLEFHVGLI